MAVLLLLASLIACGREETDSPPIEAPTEPAPEPEAVGEVDAADELGPFASDVTDIAFWTNQRLPFEGLALVTTASGLAAFNIEDGQSVSEVEAEGASGVEVVYAGSGAAARGLAIVSAEGRLNIHEISNETRTLEALSVQDAPSGVEAFCAGPDRNGDMKLFALFGREVASFTLSLGRNGVVFSPDGTAQAPSEVMSCAVDPLDGAVFLAGANANIYRLSSGDIGPSPFARSETQAPAAIGLALGGLVEGGATEECCGQLALLDGSTAIVHFFDRDDGAALGGVRLTSSYDVEGVAVATAMGVGFGNFGAIYRDGVLALATDGETPHVRLAPLNGVLDAIAAPMGATADPRALLPQAPAEDGLIIDVDVIAE